MASEGELTLVQTALDTTAKHDFVSPQVSVDSILQQEKQEMEAAQTYILQQAYPTIQILIPLCDDAKGPRYTIRLDTVGSFLKPQPHILITVDPGGLLVAEVDFQLRGLDATILYKNDGTRQELASQNPHDQIFECAIDGRPHRWHPLGPSKSVFELTEETNKRAALFVYEEGLAQRTGISAADRTLLHVRKIGQVHIIASSLREPVALQQTLFSAVVVVEQAKRRATSLAGWVATAPRKTHFPSRRCSRPDGAGGG